MQTYSENTANAYNRIWSGYGAAFGEIVVRYLTTAAPNAQRVALDLGCGTGSLARVLFMNGFRVTAIDSSSHMLAHAEANCEQYVAAGLGSFVRGDIREFQVDAKVGIAVSSYDTINHLESLSELRACFACVASSLLSDGTFMFDLNTIRGLDDWNRVKITDREGYAVISRGFFDPQTGRAWKKFSGFYSVENGLYERFEEVIFNTAFRVADVLTELQAAGFAGMHVAALPNLSQPVEDPEAEDRVVFVARRGNR
jgi:SAM-dependent methyltransferase